MFVDSTNGRCYSWHESNGVKKIHNSLLIDGLESNYNRCKKINSLCL